jgi:hypothetical protein
MVWRGSFQLKTEGNSTNTINPTNPSKLQVGIPEKLFHIFPELRPVRRTVVMTTFIGEEPGVRGRLVKGLPVGIRNDLIILSVQD